MARRITKKILRGKEAFELYIKHDGDKKIFVLLAEKYNLAEATIRGDISQYKKRTLGPKPTEEELTIYAEIVKRNHVLAGMKSVQIHRANAMVVDKSIINDLVNMKYTRDLIDYLVNSEFTIADILKNIDLVINTSIVNENELKKLDQINNIIKEQRENVNNTRKSNAQKMISDSTKEKDRQIVALLLEQALIEGIERLDALILNSRITKAKFDKIIPSFANGTKEEQTLLYHYNNEIKSSEENLKDYFIKIEKYLDEGIIKNNIKTYFSIIDYFKLTSLPTREFKKRGLKLVRENKLERIVYNKALKFLNGYETSWRVLSSEEALNYHYSVSGKTLSRQDLEKIVDYIENTLGLKLYAGVFQETCNEAIKEILDLKQLSVTKRSN